MNLLSYVHLEFCTAECCKQLIEMIGKGDVLQSRNYRYSVLKCISRKLLYGTGIEYDENNYNSRYFLKNGFPLSNNAFEEIKKGKVTKENRKETSLSWKC